MIESPAAILADMGKSWQYPAWRRVVMQITLAVVFLATLGVAELVILKKRSVSFAGARTAGVITATFPSGWVLEQEDQPPLMFELREPGPPNRVMAVRAEHVAAGISAVDYLKNSRLLHGTVEVIGETSQRPATVAGAQGIMVIRQREIDTQVGPDEYVVDRFAVGIVPGNVAVSVELESPQGSDIEADQQLLLDTARQIRVSAEATGK